MLKITITNKKDRLWYVDMADGAILYPQTEYGTAKMACARVLQLLDIDMVSAQDYPEKIGMGNIENERT